MHFKNLNLLAFAAIFLLAGCSKEEKVSEEDRIATEKASQDYVLAENTFDEVFKLVDAEAKKQGDLNGFQSPDEGVDDRNDCPDVSLTFVDNTIFPATLALSFDDGCTAPSGATVSGTIVAIFDGLLFSPGTTFSLRFIDFVHNGNTVNGDYILSNDGEDANGQWTFTATIDGELNTADGRTINYQSQRVSKMIEGNDTNFFTDGLNGIFDDVWSTTQESTLTNSDGLLLTVSTADAIRSPLVCRWPVSGFLELNLNIPATTGSLDFGDGTCDNKALLTIGGQTIELEL
ncbi:MAG: hypothetical protein DHS20C18_46220 [Saprospiraceae bacterium]|nr:MAG: hypothetical protein DHS20C18_46220 [Saprospiraceae bacterium]